MKLGSLGLLLALALTLLVPSRAFAEEGGFAAYLKQKKKENTEAAPKSDSKEEISKEEDSLPDSEPEPAPPKKSRKSKKSKKTPESKNHSKAASIKKAESKNSSKPSGEPAAVKKEEKKSSEPKQEAEAKTAPQHPGEKPNAEPTFTSAKEMSESLIVKTSTQCLVVEFNPLPNGVLSCKEPLPVVYTKRDCASSKVLEIGETEAHVSCPDKKRVDLRFRTSKDAILVSLKAKKDNNGRSGIETHYVVESASEEETSLSKLLAVPKLREISGETPEESPLKLKFSGYAALEVEGTHRYGYDVAGGQRNFDGKADQPSQSNQNFFTNFGFEATRDRTSLVSLFEIGELYFGDTASGGAQGARATNVFEVRNLYLSHSFSENLGFKGGVITTASDPRSFIFNDHIATMQGTYKTDLSEGILWYGEASKNLAGGQHLRDHYIGGMGTLGFLTALKATMFVLERRKDSDQLTSNDGTSTLLVGDSMYHWAGGTLDMEPITGSTLQVTAIQNWVKTKLQTSEDKFTAQLYDLRLSQAWGGSSFITSLEGLYTSGAAAVLDANTGKAIQGKRKNFVSPIGAAYLLSIATSDGVDDSPGSPKQSIIANLNLEEGLRILVASVNANLTRSISGFLRYGYLNAGNGSGPTRKVHLGQELDLGLQYQLTPSTALLFDYGYFKPGDFYLLRDSAKLAAGKIKFSF